MYYCYSYVVNKLLILGVGIYYRVEVDAYCCDGKTCIVPMDMIVMKY